MVYYKATNRFKWFTTKPQTGLFSLLTDLQTGLSSLLTDLQTGLCSLLTVLHTGVNGLLTDLHAGLIALLQSHKPVYLVYCKSPNQLIWFTNRSTYRFRWVTN